MRSNWYAGATLVLAAAVVVLAACGGNLSLPPPTAGGVNFERARGLLQRGAPSGSSKLQHVVIIIQENRSLNNLFYGFSGANTQGYGYDSQGNKVTLASYRLEAGWDLSHDSASFFESCNGTGSIPGTHCRMNGFNKEKGLCYTTCPPKNAAYGYVPQSETKPYFAIGQQYVLADETYASNIDESSFVAHQYLIAAQAARSVNFPLGDWGCSGGSGDTIAIIGPDRQVPYGREQVCFGDMTLGQEADNAGVSWAVYASSDGLGKSWNGYQANQHVYYGSDWENDVITPPSQFLTDVSNGKLRQITWITPTLANSDHAGSGSNTGPSWVASVINAIGQSQYWDNTAIFVIWDDPGGWYDAQPPAYADYDGLGLRVPMLVVSAYAKQGHVSHTHYEFGSILKFVEDTFGLGRLSASDKRATSPAGDCFNFNQTPRKFQKIQTLFDKAYFMHQPLDVRPPDNE